MTHQFSLFGFQRPRVKVPISAERIKEIRDMISKRDQSAYFKMRELREDLERFEDKIK